MIVDVSRYANIHATRLHTRYHNPFVLEIGCLATTHYYVDR